MAELWCLNGRATSDIASQLGWMKRRMYRCSLPARRLKTIYQAVSGSCLLQIASLHRLSGLYLTCSLEYLKAYCELRRPCRTVHLARAGPAPSNISLMSSIPVFDAQEPPSAVFQSHSSLPDRQPSSRLAMLLLAPNPLLLLQSVHMAD